MTPNDVKIVADNIHDFIEVPGGTLRLRQAFITLAVSGKLVVQNINEGNADELLKKHQNKADPINHDNIPFSIPDSWRWVRLGEIAEIYNGNSINKQIKLSEYSNINSGYAYIATKDINRETHSIDYLNGIKIPHNKTEFKIAPKDSVLICSEGGNAGRKICILSEDVCFGNKLFATVTDKKIVSDFIFFTFLSDFFQSQFQSKVSGIIGGISISNFKNLKIALPPSKEQERIIAKLKVVMKQLDELEAKKRECDEVRTRLARSAMQSLGKGESKIAFEQLTELIKTPVDLKELESSLLTLAVSGKLVPQDEKEGTGENLHQDIQSKRTKFKIQIKIEEKDKLFSIPPSWLWTRLEDVFDVRDGTHDSPKYHETGYPLVTSKNLYHGSLDFLNVKYISEDDHKKISERSKVDRDDVLFAMIGSIGNPVIVDTDTDFSIKNVALFKYYDRKLSEPNFLLMYLKYAARNMIARSAGGVQAFVSLSFLRQYPFPLPPLAEQKRIVKKVEEIMFFINKLKKIISEEK